MRKLFLSLFFFTCLQASAQRSAYTFKTSAQAGLLEGARGSAFQLQTINGFQKQTWFAGLGAGLDYYHTRSIPLFLNVRKAFFGNEKTPFLYINGGYHFPWLKEQDEQWYTNDAKGGLYYDAGIGYQLPVMSKSAFFISAGFSQKNFSMRHDDVAWIAIWPAPPAQRRLHEYQLRRLSIQTGLRF